MWVLKSALLAPTNSGYIEIYSNERAFAALKADGSITTWGSLKYGGKNAPNAPTEKGYTKIYSTTNAFAALKTDGSIKGVRFYLHTLSCPMS
jgi:hypothetical protein